MKALLVRRLAVAGLAASLLMPPCIGQAQTVPSNGVYVPATNTLGFSTNSTEWMEINSTGAVGIGTTSPTAGTALDLGSNTTTANSSILLPVGTTGTRPTTGVPGMLRYNSTTPAVEAYVGGAWASLGGGGGSGTVNSGTLYQYAYYAATGTAVSGDSTITTDSGHDFILTTGNLAIGTTAVTNAINLKGSAAQTVSMVRTTTAVAGNNLTVQAGGGKSATSNLNGGNLVLASGISTGTGTSGVVFTVYPSGSSGTGDNTALTALTLSAAGVTGTTAITGLQANNGSGTNQNGGALTLASGISTGTGTSSIGFNVYGAGSSGSTTNSATTAMTIASTGNVGIGTTSPAATLDILTSNNCCGGSNSNGLGVTGNVTDVSMGLKNSSAAGHDWRIISSGTGSSIGAGDFNIFDYSAGGLARLSITSTGSVGIGTTNPLSLLHVYGGNILAEGTNGSPGITLQNDSSTGATYPDIIISEFNGGHGGTPGFTLINSRGSSASPSAIQSGDYLGQVTANGQWGSSFGNQSQSAAISFIADGAFTSTSLPTDITFSAASSGSTGVAERMRISANGNVGIGTASPGALLDVEGTAAGGVNLLKVASSGYHNITVDNYGAFFFDRVVGFAYDGNQTHDALTTISADLYITTDGYGGSNNNIMIIPQGTGNVGIGTTNPQSLLHTQAATGVNNVLLIDEAANNEPSLALRTSASNSTRWDIQMGNTSDTPPSGLKFEYALGTSAMVISTGGNVGIGTTSPVVALDLSQKTDAVALPVGTTGARPTGVNGMLRYNSSNAGLEGYINGSWGPFPVIVARADATAQTANVASTTLLTPSANTFYRMACETVITTAATTSSTLPSCNVVYTDVDTGINFSRPLIGTSAGNAVGTFGTTSANAPSIIYAKSGVAVQYKTTGYASSGATAMQYAIHITLEQMQ